jgi:hypothetical protein
LFPKVVCDRPAIHVFASSGPARAVSHNGTDTTQLIVLQGRHRDLELTPHIVLDPQLVRHIGPRLAPSRRGKKVAGFASANG